MKPHNLIEKSIDPSLNNEIVERASSTSNRPLAKRIFSSVGFLVLCLAIVAITPLSLKLMPKAHTDTQEVVVTEKQMPAKYTDAYIWTAKLKLEDLKLNHRLKINSNDANSIKIDGNISPQEVGRWEEFLNWYHGKEGFPMLTHSVNASAIEGNIPELKSVWFNNSPTAYFADGSFGKIGSVLNDGWKIVSIEAWAVFVERDGTTITLAY